MPFAYELFRLDAYVCLPSLHPGCTAHLHVEAVETCQLAVGRERDLHGDPHGQQPRYNKTGEGEGEERLGAADTKGCLANVGTVNCT
jgi:hypothetical protein